MNEKLLPPALAGNDARGVRRPPVDPRFRRRWAEARRAEGRRRLRALLAGLGVLAMGGGVVGALHSPLFEVRHVVVTGDRHTPRSAILRAAGLSRGTLMIEAGSSQAVSAVESLPWVRNVRFEKRWPWSLVVRVQERSPAGLVPAGTRVDVVDGSGRVLESVLRNEAPALPLVEGALGAAQGKNVRAGHPVTPGELAALLSAAKVTPPGLDRLHVTLAYTSADGIVARLGGMSAKVVLGDASGLRFKLAVLAELAARTKLSGYSLVDLSVPERPALTPLGA